ncbi:related to GYP1 - GTPase activating protein [Ustilago bromivora]|uniref:Related to GYP1 - GTPase activating protein n=1 Tax=Ustilago bromivora TaxID=307758 RepID=A0A8H8QSH2_9BASI|nr:related to GYP1 - GTPase activating protein [Ustilago bromivora]
MSIHDYSAFEDLIPRLPDMVQGRFRRLINNKTYSTPEEPKDGPIFEYIIGINGKQIVTPLTIMIECASHLYFATHELGPFHTCFDLGRQMRARVNFFIANKEWDATRILDPMTEGPMDLEATAADLEVELNVASSEGGNAMQDSTMDEASDVAQTLTTTSKLCVALIPTAREFTFDPIATAGGGLIITGPSFIDAMAGHRGLSTSLSAASHLTSMDRALLTAKMAASQLSI